MGDCAPRCGSYECRGFEGDFVEHQTAQPWSRPVCGVFYSRDQKTKAHYWIWARICGIVHGMYEQIEGLGWRYHPECTGGPEEFDSF